jgi:hypothetical protein
LAQRFGQACPVPSRPEEAIAVTTTHSKADSGQGQHAVEAIAARIGAEVLRALGRPAGLHAVQVRPVWGPHFRVNVLVGVGATSAQVAHSYFLEVDGDGKILASSPSITKLY